MTDDDATNDDENVDAPVQVLMQRVHAAMPAVGKGHTAPAEMGGFKFRGIEDILAALNPILAEHHLFYVPDIVEHVRDDSGRTGSNKVQQRVVVKLRLRFIGPGGDELVMTSFGEATDTGDKATPKATTNAIKNALLAWLALPTEETAQSDTDRHVSEEAVDDPYATVEQYEQVKAAVAELPEDERPKVAGQGQVLGVQVTEMQEGKRVIVLRDSAVKPLLDKLADIKAGYTQDEPRRTPEQKPEAEREGVQPETEHEGKGYDNWTVVEINNELGKRKIDDLPNNARKPDRIARLRENDVARKAKGELADDYVEPDEAPF